jgi:hypothetical protein
MARGGDRHADDRPDERHAWPDEAHGRRTEVADVSDQIASPLDTSARRLKERRKVGRKRKAAEAERSISGIVETGTVNPTMDTFSCFAMSSALIRRISFDP